MPTELNVNIIKAMVIQESKAGTYKGGMGTGPSDPMQVNNKGDNKGKEIVGLESTTIMNSTLSISAGIKWLFYKGFDASTDQDRDPYKEYYRMDWSENDGNWDKAVEDYNGGGDADYLDNIKSLLNKTQKPEPSNYSKPVEVTQQANCHTNCTSE